MLFRTSVVTVVLSTAACGGGSPRNEDTTPTTNTTPTATPTPTPTTTPTPTPTPAPTPPPAAPRPLSGATGLLLFERDDAVLTVDLATNTDGKLEHKPSTVLEKGAAPDHSWVLISGFEQGETQGAVRIAREGDKLTTAFLPGDLRGATSDGKTAVTRCSTVGAELCWATIGPTSFTIGAKLGSKFDIVSIGGWTKDGSVITHANNAELELEKIKPGSGPKKLGSVDSENGPGISSDGATVAWVTESEQKNTVSVAPLTNLKKAKKHALGAGRVGECHFVPGDRALLCALSNDDDYRILAVNVASGKVTVLTEKAKLGHVAAPDGSKVAINMGESIAIVPIGGGEPVSLGIKGMPLSWIK